MTIDYVPDAALRSRCIPIHMIKDRGAVIELPPSYEAEVLVLQNKLLQWRLDNYFAELPEPKRLDVDPRLLQLGIKISF